ncbi:MAG: hypothetical protein QOE45_1121 [Frankiaceae bacterium]|jgi:hypothetical protein|nr:hypothetical protein [Frankiaceae bacterium]
MRARSFVSLATAGALVSLGAVVSAGTGVASAGQTQTYTIVVDDDTVTLEQTFTVTGSGPCTNVGYTVTFAYTDEDDNPQTITHEGTTDGEGGFVQEFTVPDDAQPESDTEPSVQANVACVASSTSAPSTTNPPNTDLVRNVAHKAAGGGVNSNSVTMNIVFATGVLSTDKTSGRAGTVVHVSGTNCLGTSVGVFFFQNSDPNNGFAVPVTLNTSANTFAGNYTIPNATPGAYSFGAACSGTDYNDRPFTLLATPGVTPTATPSPIPAGPVVGPVRFAG